VNSFPKFSEKKATEAAVLLLKMAGGRMKYIRLLKLLYLSDRKAYIELGRAITNDRYCSMKYGQVPSRMYDLVKGTAVNTEGIWTHFINSPVNKYYVDLKDARVGPMALSESEIDIIRSVSMEYIGKSDFDLADITKGPEYVQVTDDKKSIPTPIEKLLEKLNYTDIQVESIKKSLAEEAEIQAFFGK
jgi:hypothetical protein